MAKYIPIDICKDESSHTYIVPSELAKEFNKFNECDEDDFEALTKFNMRFSRYRIDGYMPQLYIQEK